MAEEVDFKIALREGATIYETNQQELDDVFYNVLAFGAWTKTFELTPTIKLTFMTISDKDKSKLLTMIRDWVGKEEVSPQMLEQFMGRINLAFYLNVIEIDSSIINLKEKPVEDRITFLESMAEQTVSFYSMYAFAFNEVVRMALMSKVNLKNS